MKLGKVIFLITIFGLIPTLTQPLYRVNPIGGPVAGAHPSGGATPTGAVYAGISTTPNSAVSEQYLYHRATAVGQDTLEASQAFNAVQNSGVYVDDRSVGDLGIDTILSRNPDLRRVEPMSYEDRRDLSTADGYVKLAPQ